MNPRLIILAIAAVVVAGLTAFLARQFLLGSGPEQVEQGPTETTGILVASKNLPMGHLVEPGDLTFVEWPNEGLHSNYQDDETVAIEDFNGFVVRYGLTGGEPVTTGRVVGPGEKGFLAAVLGPDMRAVSVPVDRTTGVAGFVFPGDRVDVILTQRLEDDTKVDHQVGETILKNVRVLAVDLKTNDQDKGNPTLSKSVTLEVTPKMAEMVAMMTRMGRVSLSLRSLRSVDAGEIQIFGPDDEAPVGNAQTYTWDAEVSRVVKPVNPPIQVLTVSRGSRNQIFPLLNSDELGEPRDVTFADDNSENTDNRDEDGGE